MSNTASPFFELEPCENETLPTGKRLHEPEALVGHTIKAVVQHPIGRLGDWTNMVVVTETLCWLTVAGEMSGCCSEDGTQLSFSGQKYRSETEALSDYLSAHELLHIGLISKGQFDALQELEAKRITKENAQKANALRAQLAELEGGAA